MKEHLRAALFVLCGLLYGTESASSQEVANTRYWFTSYGVTAKSAALDRWGWGGDLPFRTATTVAVFGAATLPERYSGLGSADFTLVAERSGQKVELFRDECTLSSEALGAVCKVSAWPVSLEPEDQLDIAFEFSGIPRLKWDDAVRGRLAITPAVSSSAANSLWPDAALSVVGRGQPLLPEFDEKANAPRSKFVARSVDTFIHSHIPSDAPEGAVFKTPKKLRLAELELAEDIGPGYVCVHAYPTVCRGAECSRPLKGKATAKVEVLHADGTVEKRRITQDRRGPGGHTPSCPKHEAIDFQAGDRISATVRLKKYPKTLLANSEGSESDSIWVRVGVEERVVTEPGKVKVDTVRLNNNVSNLSNPIVVWLRLCNGLDRTLEPFGVSFRRRSDGRIQKFPSPFNDLRGCTDRYCARSGPNQCRAGFFEVWSSEEGKADGLILTVVDRATDPYTVVEKVVLEGPEYEHEWYCLIGPGNC